MLNTTSIMQLLLLVSLCAVICSGVVFQKAVVPHFAYVNANNVDSLHQESLGLLVTDKNQYPAVNDLEIMVGSAENDSLSFEEISFDRHNRSIPWDSKSIFSNSLGASHNNQGQLTTVANRKWLSANMDVPFYVNINSTQIGRDDGNEVDFLLAIRNAANTWNNVPHASLNLRYAGRTSATSTGYNGINEVLFMNKGQHERGAVAQIWYKSDLTLVEADIWINDDHDWNASGTLESHELDLQTILVHEFGHWLVLGHSGHPDSVMFPNTSGGIIKRTLHTNDAVGISTIYPCPTMNCTVGNR